MKNLEKRRREVYDLCVKKHQSPSSVAEVMKVSERTIRNDIGHLNKQMAKELFELGHEQLLIGLIEDQREAKARIHKRLAMDIPETARAKYETVLMDADKLQERFFEKLYSMTKKAGGSKLEDALSGMSFTKFCETVGLPLHPYTKLPGKVTQAQLKVVESVHPSKRSWIALNKARQCGFTEVVLRTMAWLSFSKYRGKKIAIVAGTRVETTEEIFDRLKALFRNIGETVKLASADVLELKNDTSFHVVPASKHAINGWSGFAAFLLDESAFWNLEEDTVILNSFLPIARTNSSDVFMISNPNGPRGFFYHIIDAPSPSWTKLQIDIHEGGKELYTPEQITEMIESSDEDPASSYLCKFVGGRDSIFGDLSEDDISSIYEAVSFD